MNTSEDADLLPAEPEEALFMQKFMQKLLPDWLFDWPVLRSILGSSRPRRSLTWVTNCALLAGEGNDS
jgi:hypothetical protein